MNFEHHVIQYVIDIVNSCGEKLYNWKKKRKVPGKYKWETPDIIPLMPLVGVNHRQPILHESKIIVPYYSTDESINQFAIGYIINPSLNCKKVFRIQFKKFLSL